MHSISNLLNISGSLTVLEKLVYAGLISLAVVLAGIGVKYWIDKRASIKSSKLDFSKAAIEFRAAFTEEINKLARPYQSIEADKPQMIIRNAAIKHKNAMDKFRPYVDKASKPAFDNAWKAYKGENKYISTGQEDQKNKRQLALDNINKLLKIIEQHK